MALALPSLAGAQPSADPADPKAPAAPLRYQSAFADYRPWQDVKPGNWRQLNDNLVGQGTPAAAPSPAPAASTPPADHGDHHRHHQHGGKP